MRGLLKFTLDLFDAAPQAARLHELPPTPPRLTPAPSSLPLAPPTHNAIQVFSRHPLANQETRLQGHTVDYELLRSRKRTITFAVSAAGLSVRAPFGLSQQKLDEALQEKARWIVRKLQGMQQRQSQMTAQRVVWQNGAVLMYLGEALQVKLVGQIQPQSTPNASALSTRDIKTIANNAQLIRRYAPNNPSEAHTTAWQLALALPANTAPNHIKDVTKAWLLNQAAQHYTARMNHFAALLNVQWRSLALSNAGTRWGSAKADGSIRLHWRLIQFTPDMIDYVVAHELSHLRELNHSPRFWATLASVLPDYKVPEKALKTVTLPVWE